MKRKTTKRKKKPMFDRVARGDSVRKFNGKTYTQSGSYRSKAQAIQGKKYAKSMSGLARVVKLPKGYVLYTNYSKTRGKLVPKNSKRKPKKR